MKKGLIFFFGMIAGAVIAGELLQFLLRAASSLIFGAASSRMVRTSIFPFPACLELSKQVVIGHIVVLAHFNGVQW